MEKEKIADTLKTLFYIRPVMGLVVNKPITRVATLAHFSLHSKQYN